MVKNSQLIQFVNELKPQTSPVKLTFFNYLKSFHPPHEPVDENLINQFFRHCLIFPHWADHKTQLSHEIESIIENFNKTYGLRIATQAIRWPNQLQLIEIERQEDLLTVTENYFSELKSKNERLKLVNDQNKRVLAFILHEDGSVSVTSIDRKFIIDEGMLRPLRDDLTLHYTPTLELSEHFFHKVEISPYILGQFNYDSGKIKGGISRGFMFQRMHEWNLTPLETELRLLYPLKRIEQYFLDKNSDSFYKQLTQKLERTVKLIQAGDREALSWAPNLLENAQTAYELAFIDDKLLGILIRDLRSETNSKKRDLEECLTLSPLENQNSKNFQNQSRAIVP